MNDRCDIAGVESLTEAVERGLRPEAVFKHVVCLEWYDGPLSGMLAFRNEPFEFRFDLVDDAQVLGYRVYKIAPLPQGTIDRFVNLLAQLGHATPPHWPVWVPIWHFPSDADRSAANSATEELLRVASLPVAAFCWSLADDRITAYRVIRASDSMPEDWFPWLGLIRPGARAHFGSDDVF
jgi:hypothetical protein